ncbi:acyl-CoA carboxylase subunit epsilon [Microbispora hainanensis]|uniref:acyl-CoA carboxylase epsilon subunit n=1 Tax=Microbispora hainanensis TaxID=568844 RepID=UPI002E29B164|nr:acyl-CoA carboxylase epsilon subunit [Microbispora hainanensis]
MTAREPARTPVAVVRGAPTDEQLAAVLAVLSAASGARGTGTPPPLVPRPRWSVESVWRPA